MDNQQSLRMKLQPKPQIRRHLIKKVQPTKKTALTEEPVSHEAARIPRELSSSQLDYAQGLANIGFTCHQRPDVKLLERMRKKQVSSMDSGISSSPLRTPTTSDKNAEPSIPPLIPTPQQPRDGTGWERQALQAIKRHSLSLDKVWTTSTWNMKSSMPARLKLLKNDGYDITPLLVKGITSDQVTKAVLDHIEIRKQGTATSPDMQHGTAIQKVYSHSGAQQSTKGDGIQGHHLKVLQYLIPQKRKHSHEDEEPYHDDQDTLMGKDPTTTLCTYGPTPTRLCISTLEVRERIIERNAFDLFMKRIAREIFRSSQVARKAFPHLPVPLSSTASTPQLQMTPRPPVPISKIVFAALDPSPRPREPPDVYIGARGFGHMLDEIKYLFSTEDSHGTRYLLDPEESEDREGYGKDTDLMEYKVIDAAGDYNLIDEQYRHRIVMAGDVQGRVILQGDARTLQGLLTRFRTAELIHPNIWRFDGMDMVREDNVPMSLPEKTKTVLKKIVSILETGKDSGGVVVLVEQIYDGKKLRYS
ncbi:Nn.00g117950.m01.CDS01 [Neocucurbitaria sp. VM-36]